MSPAWPPTRSCPVPEWWPWPTSPATSARDAPPARSGNGYWLEPPGPDQDERRGGRGLPRRAEDRDLRHARAQRPPAPDAALVRQRRDRAARLDLRQVAEG